MRKIVGSIGAVIMIAVFITVFMAHFITNTDPATNIMYDSGSVLDVDIDYHNPLIIWTWIGSISKSGALPLF